MKYDHGLSQLLMALFQNLTNLSPPTLTNVPFFVRNKCYIILLSLRV